MNKVMLLLLLNELCKMKSENKNIADTFSFMHDELKCLLISISFIVDSFAALVH